MTRFKTFIFVLIVAATLCLFACDSGEQQPSAPKVPAKPATAPKAQTEMIKMGVAGVHSGKLAALGIPAKHAADLAIREINSKGGIFSRQVEMIVADDKCEPEAAAAAATRLVEKGVIMVLGHICSGATKAALEVYTPANVIVMSPSSTNPALTYSGAYPTFFRTISPDDAQAKIQVNFVLETLKLSNIAVLHGQDDYGKGLADFAAKFLEQSGKAKIVLHEGITPGAEDYADVLGKIEAAGAEVIMYGGYHPTASRLVTQMRERNMNAVFISGDGVKDKAFIKGAGKHANGVYATAPRDTSATPMAIKAIRAHRQTYKTDPGTFFLNAYAGALAIFNAIKRSGSLESNSIRRFLRSSHVETPLGTITFDRNGDISGYGFSLFQVKNGNFVDMGGEKRKKPAKKSS